MGTSTSVLYHYEISDNVPPLATGIESHHYSVVPLKEQKSLTFLILITCRINCIHTLPTAMKTGSYYNPSINGKYRKLEA